MSGYEWDDEKNEINLAKHGVGFDAMADFEWDYASGPQVEFVDQEEREKWLGPIRLSLYVAIVTMRGETIRMISLRPAVKSEKREWRREFQDE
jgi:uncharacterized DUF497 family protein